MSEKKERQGPLIDTGLQSLVEIARSFQLPVELAQLVRAYALEPGPVDETTLLRAAKDLHLRVKRVTAKPADVPSLPCPALLKMQGGNYLVLRGVLEDGSLVVQDLAAAPEPFAADTAAVRADFSGTAFLFGYRYEPPAKEGARPFGWSWFFPFLRKYLPSLRNVFLLSLLLQGLGLAAPFFTQVIIDQVLVHRSLDTLDILLCGMVFSALFQQWMEVLRSFVFVNVTSRLDAMLSSRFFETVLRLPMQALARWQTGDIVSRAGELETLRQFFTGSSLTLVLDVLFALLYFAILLHYDTYLTLVVLGILCLFAILSAVSAPILERLVNRRFLAAADSRSFLIEALHGIRAVKSFGVEGNFITRYEDLLARYVHAAFAVVKFTNVTGSIGLFLQQAFSLSILALGAVRVMEGEFSVGALIAFQMIAGLLITPVLRIVGAWQYFQQCRVSMHRLGDIMHEPQEAAWSPGRTTLPVLSGRIRLVDVTFSYRGDAHHAVEHIDLDIRPGLHVGIVGRSGSGKSTLTKLLQRLYAPDRGRILIDGVDIAQVEPAWLRRQLGVVPQESALFAGTIEENIRIAVPNATKEDVVRAATLAGAADFIERLPHGYATFVGEGGKLLSGGQRQRIAIARALMTDPRILIFDEFTSALDAASEAAVMAHMEEITAGRTVLMIAHRLQTVRGCDAILVMDEGRIVEAGTHEELLAAGGLYAQLVQSGDAP